MSNAEDLRQEFTDAREKKGLPPSRLPPGSGGPYDTDMDRRVTSLETDVKVIKSDLTDIKVSLAKLDATVTALVTSVGRLDGKIPTGWSMIGMFASIVTMLVIVFGLIVFGLRLAGVIPSSH